MNRLAEKIAVVLGSAWIVGPYAFWVVFHTITVRDYVTAISDVTFLAALLILRDDKVQADRIEKQNKRIIKLLKAK